MPFLIYTTQPIEIYAFLSKGITKRVIESILSHGCSLYLRWVLVFPGPTVCIKVLLSTTHLLAQSPFALKERVLTFFPSTLKVQSTPLKRVFLKMSREGKRKELLPITNVISINNNS